MKKIIIGMVAITMCVSLAACGNSTESTAINNLSNQLDETSHVVSNIQTINPADVSITKPSLESLSTQSERLYNNAISTQTSLLSEDYYKMEILNRTSKIKADLGKDVKLSKAQANAIKDLTSLLAKYTNSVSYTKNELDSTVKSISSLKKNTEKNAEKINAKLLRLASNSNTRSCYYQNILNTLDQIEDYINCDDCDKSEENAESDSSQENSSIKKNIDTYLPNESEENKTVETPNSPVMPIYNSNNFNRMNYRFMNGAYGGMYGMPNGYQNGMYPNAPYGYNNMYGYENGAYGVNPMRNTDTYGPMMRNIDTYKDVPATKLEKTENTDDKKNDEIKENAPRLENFEEVEDGIVKNVENKSFEEIKKEVESERQSAKPTQARILDVRNLREQETSAC